MLIKLYAQHQNFDVVSPLSWNKPLAVARADQACGDAVATGVVLHTLARMEYAKAKSYGERPEANEQAYDAMVIPFGQLSAVTIAAQLAMEKIEAVAEYRWLQANVEGDFTSKPSTERARFTQTSALLNDRRLQELKQTAADPAKVAALETDVRKAFSEYRQCLEELSAQMKRVGPLYGFHSAEMREVAVRDHEYCTDILIPYMQDSIRHVEAELTALGRIARLEGATRMRAANGMDAPNVTTLNTQGRTPHQTTPNANAVGSVVRVDFNAKKLVEKPADADDQPYLGGERERRAWQVREDNNNPDGPGPTRRH